MLSCILRCGSVQFGKIEKTMIRFGAISKNRRCYGAVRCFHVSYGAFRYSFQKSEILRCGSVRFSDIVNPTVRFGALMHPTVRFGTVSKIENPTVRFGGVFKNRKCYCAVWCFHVSYGGVRCGLNKSGILRSGSVRFSDIVNRTVRFGAVIYPTCLLYTSPSPRDKRQSRMPSSA